MTKIYRPPWEEILAMPQMTTVAYWECPGCGKCLTAFGGEDTTRSNARKHWQAGCFDKTATEQELPSTRTYTTERTYCALCLHELDGYNKRGHGLCSPDCALNQCSHAGNIITRVFFVIEGLISERKS